MTKKQHVRLVLVVVGLATVVASTMLFNSPRVQAHDDGDDQDSRIERGFEIAPVPSANLKLFVPAVPLVADFTVCTPFSWQSTFAH